MSFIRATATLSLLLLGATGCAKRPPPEVGPAFTSAQYRASWTDRFAYIDHTGRGTDLQAPGHLEQQVVDECAAAAPSGEVAEAVEQYGLSSVGICSTTRDGQAYLDTLRASHPTGEVYLGIRPEGGEWRLHPPKHSILAAFDIGTTWAARHGEAQVRRCEVERTPWCGDGVAVACLSLTPHRVTWVRNHWCPDHGQVGHEGLVVSTDAPPYWSWSSEPHREDRPLPDLPLDQRPLPDLEVMMGMAVQLTPALLQQMPPEDARLPE